MVDDIEQIKQLKYRYLRTLDLKRWVEFAEVLVPTATGDYGTGLTFANRDDLVRFMRTSLGPEMVTLHHCHHPEITVTGGAATGTWYLQDKVIMTEHHLVLEGAAFYEDRYVRTPEGWRIVHTGYRRTYEATIAFDDLPGYRLKIPAGSA